MLQLALGDIVCEPVDRGVAPLRLLTQRHRHDVLYWKWERQRLADETGLEISGLPFSTWRQQVEEDRTSAVLLHFLTQNWHGKPFW
jgi:hypothetical protein